MPTEWSTEEVDFLEEMIKESMKEHGRLKWKDGINESFQAKYPKRTILAIRSHYRDLVKYKLTSSRSSAEGKMMSMASSAEEEMPAAEEEMPARKKQKQTQDAPEVAKENPTAADVGEDPTGGLPFHVEEPTAADVGEDPMWGLPIPVEEPTTADVEALRIGIQLGYTQRAFARSRSLKGKMQNPFELDLERDLEVDFTRPREVVLHEFATGQPGEPA